MREEILSELVVRKIHSVSTVYTEKKTTAKRKNRALWALIIKYEGETRYLCGGREYRSDLHHIAVLPKGSDYDWYCVESGHFAVIEFDCDTTYPEILSFPVKNGEALLNVIKRMEVNRTLKKPSFALDEFRDLYGLLSALLQTVGEKYVPSAKERKIRPAVEYIAENSHLQIRNEELARVTGLSEVYFRKLFREVTGMSPMSYVLSVKMKKAKEMLGSDYSSITDIAYSLGYRSVYDFSRSFKKFTGESPTHYAKGGSDEGE